MLIQVTTDVDLEIYLISYLSEKDSNDEKFTKFLYSFSRYICLTGRRIVKLTFQCILSLKLRDNFYKWGNCIQFLKGNPDTVSTAEKH